MYVRSSCLYKSLLVIPLKMNQAQYKFKYSTYATKHVIYLSVYYVIYIYIYICKHHMVYVRFWVSVHTICKKHRHLCLLYLDMFIFQYRFSVRVYFSSGNEFQLCESAAATEWRVVRLRRWNPGWSSNRRQQDCYHGELI